MTNKDIIVFSDEWGRHPSSCQHLIRQLLDTNQVLWINTIGMRSPQLSFYDIKRCFEVIVGWASKAPVKKKQFHKNLTVLSPIIIPFNKFPFIRWINKISIRRSIKLKMKEIGMVNPVVMSTFPCTCDYVGLFEECLNIYYCVDDFVNWPGVDTHLIRLMEDELIKKSDLVIATAESLCHSKERDGRRPILLAHGVEFDHFNSAAGVMQRPAELREIPNPIIGFFGALSAWLDFDLIIHLARARPNLSFVFIGPADTDISALSGIKNIHLIGKIAYEQLPLYAACFDVGIIPFQITELTKGVNPLKLFEYLSLGLPVISSYMPEVAKYEDFVTLCHDHQDFLESIDLALGQGSLSRRHERIELARKHSWHSVAERFSNLAIEVESKKKEWPGDSNSIRC